MSVVDTVLRRHLEHIPYRGEGRTAYERITSHARKVAQVALGEVVHFHLETDKNNRLEAESEFNKGIFLGYAWRTTEYTIGCKEAIYQCRTVKRRADDIAFDAGLADDLVMRYEDLIWKGAESV